MKRYPCVSHKRSENEIVNSINYLTHGFYSWPEHRFLGFIPTYEGCVASLSVDGVNYIASHVFFNDCYYLCNDKLFKQRPYVLMFQGNDDLSYAKRFESLIDALVFFDDIKIFGKNIQDQCLIYN